MRKFFIFCVTSIFQTSSEVHKLKTLFFFFFFCSISVPDGLYGSCSVRTSALHLSSLEPVTPAHTPLWFALQHPPPLCVTGSDSTLTVTMETSKLCTGKWEEEEEPGLRTQRPSGVCT